MKNSETDLLSFQLFFIDRHKKLCYNYLVFKCVEMVRLVTKKDLGAMQKCVCNHEKFVLYCRIFTRKTKKIGKKSIVLQFYVACSLFHWVVVSKFISDLFVKSIVDIAKKTQKHTYPRFLCRCAFGYC